ncbi:hypothetical protein GGQ94_000675 [Petrimonas sulfuriphila]
MKRKVTKPKDDVSRNPDRVDTSKGREFLLMGKVKILKK